MDPLTVLVLAVVPAITGYAKYRKQRKELDRNLAPKPTSLKKRVDRS